MVEPTYGGGIVRPIQRRNLLPSTVLRTKAGNYHNSEEQVSETAKAKGLDTCPFVGWFMEAGGERRAARIRSISKSADVPNKGQVTGPMCSIRLILTTAPKPPPTFS